MSRSGNIFCVLMGCFVGGLAQGAPAWEWLPDLPVVAGQRTQPGLAGPVAGVLDGTLIVAGGANFPNRPPWEGGAKAWHDAIFILEPKANEWRQSPDWKLPTRLAYGGTVETARGLLLVGGVVEGRATDAVWLMTRKGDGGFAFESLPSLPTPVANAGVVRSGKQVFVMCGDTTTAPGSQAVYALDLKQWGAKGWEWTSRAPLPGKRCNKAAVVAQQRKGRAGVYVFGGSHVAADGAITILSDAWFYDVTADRWRPLSAMELTGRAPGESNALGAASAMAYGAEGVLVFSGAGSDFLLGRLEVLNAARQAAKRGDGLREKKLLAQQMALMSRQPEFRSDIYLYQPEAGWKCVGQSPGPGAVTTRAVAWRGGVVIPTGETRPGVRTPKVRFAPSLDRVVAPRPNIVLIMLDDMGYSDLGCFGGEIETPNIDRLAKGGLRFTQFYNCGRCCPTRASLLTGLGAHRAGLGHMATADYGLPGYRGEIAPHAVTVAESLRASGYATWMAGKWHVSREFMPGQSKHNWPRQRGFDKFYGTLIAAGSQWNPITLTEGNTPAEPKGDYYYTEVLADRAVSWMRAHPKGSPFFLYLSLTAPHWPLHAREKVIAKYRQRYLAGWDVLRAARLKKMKTLGLLRDGVDLSKRDPHVPAWESAAHREWQASRMAAYAAMIDHADTAVGRVVDALRKRGELDNTLILVFSDNGGASLEHPNGLIGSTGKPWALMRYVEVATRDGRPVLSGDIVGLPPGAEDTYAGYGYGWANLSNTPFRLFKKNMHEGGIASPLIVHWPAGIKAAGKPRRQLAHVMDIMPTCLEVAGRATPGLDGVSLRPTFANQPALRETLFFEHAGNRAARQGDWKLVAEFGQPWELYHLANDPTEIHDLAAREPKRLGKLRALYQDWAAAHQVEPWAKVQERIRGASRGGVVLPSQANPLARRPDEVARAVKAMNAERKKRGLPTLKLNENK